MDADAHRRLPVPEWLELVCPTCQYPLRGLPEHRCPECGTRFDVDALIRPETPLRLPEITASTRPVPDFDFFCQSCDYPLRGLPGDRCPECGERFDLNDFIPDEEWVEVPAGNTETERRLLYMELRNQGIPCIWGQGLDALEVVMGSATAGSGSRVLRVRRDYYLDALAVLSGLRESAGGFWQCPRCGEKVPGNFEICWKCGSGRGEKDEG